MPDYSKTIIYMLLSTNSEVVTNYIDHTTLSLDYVLNFHKQEYENYNYHTLPNAPYFHLFDNGNVIIQKLEDYPCESKLDAYMRVKHWRKQYR